MDVLPPDNFVVAFLPLEEGRGENAGGFVINQRFDWSRIQRDWDIHGNPLVYPRGEGGIVMILRRHVGERLNPFRHVGRPLEYKVVDVLRGDEDQKWFGRRLVQDLQDGWFLAGFPTVSQNNNGRQLLVPLQRHIEQQPELAAPVFVAPQPAPIVPAPAAPVFEPQPVFAAPRRIAPAPAPAPAPPAGPAAINVKRSEIGWDDPVFFEPFHDGDEVYRLNGRNTMVFRKESLDAWWRTPGHNLLNPATNVRAEGVEPGILRVEEDQGERPPEGGRRRRTWRKSKRNRKTHKHLKTGFRS